MGHEHDCFVKLESEDVEQTFVAYDETPFKFAFKVIKTIENPIDFKYTGIIGYNISLAVSVSKLMIDKIQTVLVI